MDEITILKAQAYEFFMQIEHRKAIIQQANVEMREITAKINEINQRIAEIKKAGKDGPDKTTD